MKYIVYNKISGKILRTGLCSKVIFSIQAKDNEIVIEGTADDLVHAINITTKTIRDKTQQEIDNDEPVIIAEPLADQQALITNKDLQKLKDRLDSLER